MDKNKWLFLINAIAPIVVGSFVPGGALIAPLISRGMSEAMGLSDGAATGAQKKAHVQALVTVGVSAINAASGKTVLDPDVTDAAASSAIDTTIALIHLIEQSHETLAATGIALPLPPTAV